MLSTEDPSSSSVPAYIPFLEGISPVGSIYLYTYHHDGILSYSVTFVSAHISGAMIPSLEQDRFIYTRFIYKRL